MCPAVAALVLALVACSGDGDKQSSATSGPAAATADEPGTVAVTDITTTTTVVTPEITERVRGEVNEPVLGTWMTAAIASSQAPADAVCTTVYTPMDGDTYERAAQVGDPVISEMLLNLDAALTAAAEWCRRSDSAAATAEYSDAQATAAAVQARLTEIGVR